MPGDHQEDGIPVIKVKDYSGKPLSLDGILRTSYQIEKQYHRSRVIEGDILMSIRGGTGEITIVPAALSGANITQDTARLRAKDESFREYLPHALQGDFVQRQIELDTVGQAVTGINIGSVRKLVIPIPPIAERSKISTTFRAWDRAIETLESLIAAKSDRKRGLMQQLLTGRIRLPGNTKRWHDVKLGKLLKHIFRPVDWAPDQIFHLVSIRRRSRGLFARESLRGDEYKTRDLHEVHEGDFLISKRQVSHGALAMVRKEFHGCHVSKEYTILENRDPDRLHMPFFDWLSRTRRMWWLAHVVSSGVALEKLIFLPKDFLKFSIKLPPTLVEQEQIVNVLETCDRELALLRQQLEALREQKRGLMQKLLTGEVRVK